MKKIGWTKCEICLSVGEYFRENNVTKPKRNKDLILQLTKIAGTKLNDDQVLRNGMLSRINGGGWGYKVWRGKKWINCGEIKILVIRDDNKNKVIYINYRLTPLK